MKTLALSGDVSFPLNFVTSKCAILAMQGRGKTHVAKVLAEEMLKAGQQIVVADPTGVWWGLTADAKGGKREGFPVLVVGGDNGEIPLSATAGAEMADVVVAERLSIVLDMSAFDSDAQKVRFMTAFCDRLYRQNRRPLHLFLDEADEFIPQNPNADETRMLHVVKRIWQRGRVKGLGGTIISQRSAVVHKTVLAQSSTLIALQTMGPQDRKALSLWFDSGYGTAEQAEEFRQGIASLPKHVAWIFSPEFGIYAKTKARQLETFDSSATPDVEHGVIRAPEKRARIGLDRLKKIMATAVEEAEANDIEKVRAKAKHFEEQFKIANARMKLLEERLSKRQAPEVVRPDLRPASRKLVDAQSAIARFSTELDRAKEQIAEGIATWLGRIQGSLAAIEEAKQLMGGAVLKAPQRPPNGTLVAEFTAPAGPQPRPYQSRQEPSGNGGGPQAGGERRMLVALAQHGRLERSRWRMLSGVAREASFRTYISRFRVKGWIEQAGGDYVLTEAGIAAVGHYEPLPKGRALADWWSSQFGGGEGKIFAYLLDHPRVAYPSRDLHLAVDAGMAEASFRTYISRLAVAGVIKKDSEGRIQLDSGLRDAVA